MHTCLPEDETVEGHAHGPQVQSLGESEQRHHFRGLNTHVQPALEQTVLSNCKREGCSANLFQLFIYAGKYGASWSMT